MEDKKKWEENMVRKIDLTPGKPDYYDNYTVQPGFEFFMSIVSAGETTLKKLQINIPDMIYVNYNAYLLTTDVEKKQIKVINAKDPNEFLDSIKEKSRYDTKVHWN